MSSWPLERIPGLSVSSFLAVLQSMTQAHMASVSPLGFPAAAPEEFERKTWADLGCSEKDAHTIMTQFLTMFALESPLPNRGESIGAFAADCFHAWRRGARTVTFFTSGSTGKPKPCTHPEEHLRQELMGIAPLITDCSGALVTAPLHHMYGFTFGLLLPAALDLPVRLEAPLPTAVASQMRKGDMIVAIPLLWTRLNSLVVSGQGQFLLSGAAPLPPEVFSDLLAKGFRMVEFFGSSEMGVMCRRLAPRIPFTLLPQFTRRVEDLAGESLERVFPDGSSELYPLQDSIQWLGDRELLPRGRKDNAVQVAGLNVFPAHVAEVLRSCPCVRDCVVRLMRPEEGDRLKAFVVPAAGCGEDAARRELGAFLRKELKDEERPARIAFGTELPHNAMGKLTDW